MLANEENILNVIADMKLISYNQLVHVLQPKGITLRKIIDNCLACGIMNDNEAIEQNIKNFIKD